MITCFPLFFRTLGGLSSAFLSSLESSGNQPLSPTSSGPSKVYPETWLPMNTSQDYLQVPVSRDDRSYRTVYSLFHKTVSETKFRILKILRVQNPFLWEKYKRCGRRFSNNVSILCAIQSCLDYLSGAKAVFSKLGHNELVEGYQDRSVFHKRL